MNEMTHDAERRDLTEAGILRRAAYRMEQDNRPVGAQLLRNAAWLLENPDSPKEKAMNARAQYAPGPWQAKAFISPADTFFIADAEGHVLIGAGKPLLEGVARLVAAAPELLTALDELASAVADARGRYEAGDMKAIESNMIAATYRQALAAIAKAESASLR